MQRTHALIGLASLVGAVLLAGPASALTAYSPTGHLNVRSGPGFQYAVVAQMQANAPAPVTGCIADYSWCSVALGGVSGWASGPYLVTDAGGKLTNLQVSGAQLGIPIVVVPATGAAVVATPPVGVMVPTPALVAPIVPAPAVVSYVAAGGRAGSRQWRGDGRGGVACGRACLSRPGVAVRLRCRQRPKGPDRAHREEDRLRRPVARQA
jgi:uncharacterized protein YraI